MALLWGGVLAWAVIFAVTGPVVWWRRPGATRARRGTGCWARRILWDYYPWMTETLTHLGRSGPVAVFQVAVTAVGFEARAADFWPWVPSASKDGH